MEMVVCNTELILDNLKKKQKRKDITSEGDHRGCDPSESNALRDTPVSQESPVKKDLNLEPEVRQSHPEVILTREKKKRRKKKRYNLQNEQASGISVLNVLDIKLIEKEDETSVSPNAELCSLNGKENSLVLGESDGKESNVEPDGKESNVELDGKESNGEPDGKGTDVIKSEDDHTETVDHLAQPSCVDIQRIQTRKRRRRRRKPLKSPKRSVDEDDVPLKELSLDCSVSEYAELCPANAKGSSLVVVDPHGSVDGENATVIKKDNDCSKTKDCLPQLCSDGTPGITKRKPKKRRRKRKFADTLEESLKSEVVGEKDAPLNCLNDVETRTEIGKKVLSEKVSINCSIGLPSEIKERVDVDLSCTILEEEMKTQTKKQKVPHVLACGATNDDVGTVLEIISCSQISNSSKERDARSCSKKKLLILDVNGLLVDFVPYFPGGRPPDIIISKKSVFKRPFCDDFLRFCFERFEVGVWSSRTWKNLNMLIKFLMRDSRHKLLFCWDQSHCTTTRFTTIENSKKPLVLKELKKIWENLEPGCPWKKGEYDESNTLLLDDSPYKALRNPANTAVFPTSFHYKDRKDTSLGPGGDLRVYLEGLSMAENVQKYVEQNPFGQRPISESNPFWTFYSKIINSEEER